MGYMHISNLYKDQTILLMKECYALEKIHGTSAHVAFKDGQLRYFSGGESHDRFVKAVERDGLATAFANLGHAEVTVYGEAYGGKQQRQAWRYGPTLRFVAFDVKIGDMWLSVPAAAQVAASLGFEFVHFTRVSTDLAVLDAERDAPSEQARRNGVAGDQPREGVVLRPIVEMTLNNGDRVMAKHKRAEERETKTDRKVDDPAKLEVLSNAEAIALEWVTQTRLEHVLQKVEGEHTMKRTGEVIAAMIEDVAREAKGEIVESRQARTAIGKRAAELYHAHLAAELHAAG